MTIRFKTIAQFCAESGYTELAVRGKIRDGIWQEKRVWRKAPDGHILIDIEGYYEWVENGNGLVCAPSRTRQSRSTSPIAAAVAANGSGSSPPPLT
jgi:hypothetical protein